MIGLALPSRGRPAQFREAIESALDTADTPPLICVRLDADDPTEYDTAHCLTVRGPRTTLGRAFDEAARFAVKAGADHVMMAADDLRWRTPSWDTIITESFDWPVGLVYGRDGVHDKKLATHGFVTRLWVETVGFVPHHLHGDCPDLWLMELAEAIGCLKYQPAVLTEHLHPFVGKAPIDATYQQRPSNREAHQRFNRLKTNGTFDEHVRRLREVVDSHSDTRITA